MDASATGSSTTSMCSSRRVANPRHIALTLSGALHRRTSTYTGRFCSGRNASATSPSLGSPSVMMTTTAFLPSARSVGARAVRRAVTSRRWWHSGVPPTGGCSSSAVNIGKFTPSSAALAPTRIGAAPLSRRNSVSAPAADANWAWNRSVSRSSAHLVTPSTSFMLPPPPPCSDVTMRPSSLRMLVESSHRTTRSG